MKIESVESGITIIKNPTRSELKEIDRDARALVLDGQVFYTYASRSGRASILHNDLIDILLNTAESSDGIDYERVDRAQDHYERLASGAINVNFGKDEIGMVGGQLVKHLYSVLPLVKIEDGYFGLSADWLRWLKESEEYSTKAKQFIRKVNNNVKPAKVLFQMVEAKKKDHAQAMLRKIQEVSR